SSIASYVSSLEVLNSSNYNKWKERIGITFGCMDLDYALIHEAPSLPSGDSTEAQKAFYDKWERSNRMSLMIIKNSITNDIRGAIPNSDNAQNYMEVVAEQFHGTS
ncbi:hypothetical protein CFOL_v3_13402, partial [Cephalotus follicularis]